MNKNLFTTIESLNTRDFNDYKYLAFKLREVFDQYDELSRAKKIKDLDIEGYEVRATNVRPAKKIFNDKLGEFVRNFFWAGNEELIREEIQKDQEILKKVEWDTFKYFMPLNTMEMYSDRPSFTDSIIVREKHFKANLDSGYYMNPPQRKNSSDKNEGCFVATYAYNSYDHPVVLILREFRDQILYKYKTGRTFINYYYSYSPVLVKIFNRINFPKNFIRFMLNLFIKLLPNRIKQI